MRSPHLSGAGRERIWPAGRQPAPPQRRARFRPSGFHLSSRISSQSGRTAGVIGAREEIKIRRQPTIRNQRAATTPPFRSSAAPPKVVGADRRNSNPNTGGFSACDSDLMAESRLRTELRREHESRRSEQKERSLLSRRGIKGEWDAVPLEEVPQLAANLKKKATANAALLSRLQQALLEGKAYADAFLAVPGAFSALIGHLSGQKPQLALRAAFCLCNLSVHSEALTWRQTKAAAPYLTVHLDGAATQMLEACASTLGHLAVVDERSFGILQQLGALQKLTKLLQHPTEAVVASAVYALTHIVLNRAQNLSSDEIQLVTDCLTASVVKQCDCSRLLFTLSTLEVLDSRLSVLVPSVVQKMSVLNQGDLQSLEVFSELNFLLRFLANLASGEAAGAVLAAVEGHAQLLSRVATVMRKEMCWLLCNLLKHPSQQVGESATRLMH